MDRIKAKLKLKELATQHSQRKLATMLGCSRVVLRDALAHPNPRCGIPMHARVERLLAQQSGTPTQPAPTKLTRAKRQPKATKAVTR